MLLTIAVTPPDTLLDPLGVPRQVEVHNQRAELQIHAFRGGFGSNEDGGFVAKMVYDCGFHVDGTRAGDAIRSLIFCYPSFVHSRVMRIPICTVDRSDLSLVTVRGE